MISKESKFDINWLIKYICNMKNILLIIFAFFSLTFSYSQEWELISTNEDGQRIYMRPHSKISAWFKTIPYQVPTDFSKHAMDKTTEGYAIQLYRFDCELKKIGTLAYYYYDIEGNSVKHSYEYEEYDIKMSYAVPETVGEFLVNKFCELD